MLLHLQQQNAINSKTIIAFIAILGNAFYTFTYFLFHHLTDKVRD